MVVSAYHWKTELLRPNQRAAEKGSVFVPQKSATPPKGTVVRLLTMKPVQLPEEELADLSCAQFARWKGFCSDHPDSYFPVGPGAAETSWILRGAWGGHLGQS